MNKLVINCNSDNAGGIDVTIDAKCDGRFLTFAISRVIMQINEQLNDAGVFSINNGFWTILSEQINEELEEQVNEKK